MTPHHQPHSLHDLQRACIGGDGTSMAPAMELALQASFGGLRPWQAGFVELANAAPQAMPWTLLSFRPSVGALVNHHAPDDPRPNGEDLPILAFHTPPGVEAFIATIDWAGVYERYQLAVHAASQGLGAAQEDVGAARVLDVRRAGMFDKADSMIPGAQWRDPATVGTWARQLPRDEPVVVYCIYGHEVGRSTAMRLRAQGIRARFLEGGIDAWQAAGRPLAAKGAAS